MWMGSAVTVVIFSIALIFITLKIIKFKKIVRS
jgi:hypothetical protein